MVSGCSARMLYTGRVQAHVKCLCVDVFRGASAVCRSYLKRVGDPGSKVCCGNGSRGDRGKELPTDRLTGRVLRHVGCLSQRSKVPKGRGRDLGPGQRTRVLTEAETEVPDQGSSNVII